MVAAENRLIPYDNAFGNLIVPRYRPGVRDHVSNFRYNNLVQESRMLKKAAAMFLVCASMAIWVGCVKSSSDYVYASLPAANEIVAYREDPNSGVLTQLSVSPISAGEGVQTIVIHPSKKYLYATSSISNSVSVYAISSTGALTLGPTFPTGAAPSLMVMDSAGSFLYIANSAANDVSVFSIDAGNGGLSEVSGSPFLVGPNPTNMKISPSGKFLYLTSSGTPTGIIEVWSATAGVLTIVATTPTGVNPDGLAIDPSGTHLYTANSLPDNSISEFSIDSSSGELTLISTISGTTISTPLALMVDNSGKYLYVANEATSTLVGYSIASDGSLGLLTSNYSVSTNKQPSFIASDAAGKYLFVGNQSGPAIQSFNIDLSSGELTEVASYTVGSNPTSIAATP